MKNEVSVFLMLTFFSAVFLPGKLHAGGPPPTSVSSPTNYFVSGPALVTVQFTEQDSCQSSGGGATWTGFESFPPESLYGYFQMGVCGLSVTNDSNGSVIASVSVGQTTNAASAYGDQTSFGGGLAALTISGSGVGFTLSGLSLSINTGATTNLPSLVVGSPSGNANIALQGNEPISPFGVELTNQGVFQYAINYTGSFTFYAPTGGTNTITGAGTFGEGSGGGRSGDSADQFASHKVTILSITSSNVAQLPTGSISVSKNAGGAGGISLQWSITPPSN